MVCAFPSHTLIGAVGGAFEGYVGIRYGQGFIDLFRKIVFCRNILEEREHFQRQLLLGRCAADALPGTLDCLQAILPLLASEMLFLPLVIG